MLQLTRLSRMALEQLPPLPAWGSLEELEAAADLTLAAFRRQREALGQQAGGYRRVQVWLDRRLRTDRTEHLDEEGYPEDAKLRLVRTLHGMNVALGSYRRFFSWLRPLVQRAVHRHGRAARLLELCSGSGDFALSLADHARREGLPIEVTGSDIVPGYVEAARRRARQRRSAARFVVLDAMDLGREPGQSFDVVFVAQSLHHFSPGRLARTIAGARRIGALAYLGADGRRSLEVLVGLPLVSALSLRVDFVHDAAVTGLRLYSEPELDLVARLAAPGAMVRVGPRGPHHSVLEVCF